MDFEDLQRQVLELLQQEYVVEGGVNLDLDTRLVDTGLIDSHSFISIILQIEHEFGVQMPDKGPRDLGIESPRDLARFVYGLLRQGPQ